MSRTASPNAPKRKGKPRGKPFKPGNPGGPGNPHAAEVARIRAQLIAAATTDRMKEVIDALFAKAAAGDIPAIKELLDRTIGKADLNISPDAFQGITVIIKEAAKPDADD